MAELIHALTDMVEKIGIGSAMTVAVFFAALTIGFWYKRSNDRLIEVKERQIETTERHLTTSMAETAATRTALEKNTVATMLAAEATDRNSNAYTNMAAETKGSMATLDSKLVVVATKTDMILDRQDKVIADVADNIAELCPVPGCPVLTVLQARDMRRKQVRDLLQPQTVSPTKPVEDPK